MSERIVWRVKWPTMICPEDHCSARNAFERAARLAQDHRDVCVTRVRIRKANFKAERDRYRKALEYVASNTFTARAYIERVLAGGDP